MESQPQGSVRKNIALKLRDQSSFKKEGVDNAELVEQYNHLKWNHPVTLCGRALKDPLLHICENCSLPVLIYGRMKRCRHAFCRDCAKKSAGVCPKCQEADQTFEEASIGTVHICTHGGGRYDNSGCGRSYLSQRDLEAHRLYRHTKDKGLGQSVVPTHLSVPAPQSAMPGFTLPPFFQMPPRLPPGFTANLPPPPAMPMATVLRPLPPNPMVVGMRPNPLGAVGTTSLLPPPPAPPFPTAPRPLPTTGAAVPPTVSAGTVWTAPFKQ